jgi:dTDP-4-amino-4,6-dideoxygalactose transaminase
MIPIIKPTLHDFDEVMREFRQVWKTGQVTTGAFTRQFEMAVEEKLKVSHAIMVQSCTAGLMLVLRALDLSGEVILPAFTWTATAHAVVWNGLTPVFADIIPGSYVLDPDAVSRCITRRTSAVIPVNVFGCPPDYEAFDRIAQDYNVALVYDSAQGMGSKYQTSDGIWHYAGNFGEAEIFSLSPTKVVSAMEGGLITTRNRALAEKLRQMRDYGKTLNGEDIAWLGLSARVPELNAIIARHNFIRVDKLIARRENLIRYYKKLLGQLSGVTYQQIPATCISSRNYFTLFINNKKARHTRDEVYNSLKEFGVQCKKYFYPALHRQKVYQGPGNLYLGKLPTTEAAADHGLALPLYSTMERRIVTEVSMAIKKILI